MSTVQLIHTQLCPFYTCDSKGTWLSARRDIPQNPFARTSCKPPMPGTLELRRLSSQCKATPVSHINKLDSTTHRARGWESSSQAPLLLGTRPSPRRSKYCIVALLMPTAPGKGLENQVVQAEVKCLWSAHPSLGREPVTLGHLWLEERPGLGWRAIGQHIERR